ncbi:hypothetical protein [Agromyces sp. S2-1-8]|uniref:ParB family protein n=1 Tax=Agromyces sp. S2-1-8 TaxID=2897180 RepID=UPI001E3A373E|nr:hypothetical protein [Agromyces sp. S2-1-8]MCD5348438.1 hypothetical protein [Agromyces sp. S2-1-8]
MTDAPRKIGGLAPRAAGGDAPPLGRLLRENREAAPAAPAPAEVAPAVDETPAPVAATAKPAATRAARKPKAAPKRSATADTGKGTVTFYMPNDDRARARATFKATAHLEGDESFSDFLTKAVNAEVERRELEHGGPFAGGDTPLPTGRPMRS